jgi:acyl-coenzyme A thioesterase PaaI-like protein
MNGTDLVDDRRCFACGPHNADGLHLEFAPEGDDGAISRVTLPPRMQGWRDVAHGGIVMMLLDEAMAHACRFIGYRAVTASSSVRFRKPVPLGVPLVMRGHVKDRRRNVIYLEATLELEDIGGGRGTVLATGDGTFVSQGKL